MTTPTPTPMSRRKRTLIVVLATLGGMLALLLVCGVIGAAVGQPASTGRATAAEKRAGVQVDAPLPSPSATRPASPSPTPKPTPAATTTAPKAAPLTVGQRLVAWYAAGGQQRVNALGADLQAISDAGTAADFPGTRRAAVHLAADVEAARSYAPIPDAQAQGYWSAALDDFAAAARDLIAGIDDVDASALGRAGTEMSAGAAQTRLLTARIKALGAS